MTNSVVSFDGIDWWNDSRVRRLPVAGFRKSITHTPNETSAFPESRWEARLAAGA